ncbi:hypothetical protein U1Q18_026380 [Sarracenia purpurea var. burkii]
MYQLLSLNTSEIIGDWHRRSPKKNLGQNQYAKEGVVGVGEEVVNVGGNEVVADGGVEDDGVNIEDRKIIGLKQCWEQFENNKIEYD